MFAGNETEEDFQNTLNHVTRDDDEEKYNGEGNNEEILLITDEEIQAAINKLKKGKANDNKGIRAEDIKACDNETKEMIKMIFNEVFKQESCTPENGADTVKSYPQQRERRRRHNRLYPRLDQHQSEDEGGFRRSYQAIDHSASYRMTEQKCREWRVNMWLATIDFKKAFDSMSHNSTWKALDICALSSTTSVF